MLLHSLLLRDFVRLVPICSGGIALSVAIAQCQLESTERLLVVDDRHQPIGLLSLGQILALWLGSGGTEQRAAFLQQTLWDLVEAEVAIAAIRPVPWHWSVAQLVTHLAPDGDWHDVVVVDEQGHCVGVVDEIALGRSLTHLATADLSTSPTTEMATPPATNPDSLSGPEAQQILQLTQQLLAQRAELEQRIKIQLEEITALRRQQTSHSPVDIFSILQPASLFQARAGAGGLLDVLQQLLEHLPLPLMLQTNSGRVLAQNAVWCRQIGALGDPVQIWQEAAWWLGARPNLATGEVEPARSPTAPDPEPMPPIASAHCHLGETTDVCVCVCPLKDGHEQVLQFVKIPLGTLLPNLNLDWSDPIAPTATASVVAPAKEPPPGDRAFHLAALTTDTDEFIPWEAAATPQPQPAAPTAETLWLVLAQDLTEQQQLAKELTAKNADLVQLNRLKDEFLACISHELKTPLTAVLGLSSLLKDQTLGALNQRQVHYAQLIHQSSRHLMAVVNDILDLTRIETGQLDLIYDVAHIETVCQRAFEQAKQIRLATLRIDPPLEEEQIDAQFSLELEPGLELLVADELRLRQMLLHLLSNSLKFTDINQPLGLRVNRWGGWIAFTVWDTGIGIAPDKQHLIFQKFQQLENPLTRQFEGVGLGLVLTRRLARLHGGDVTFISKEGQGSQFTILLPPHPPEKTRLMRGEGNTTTPGHAESSKLSEYPSGRVPLHSPPGEEWRDDILQELRLPLQRSRLMLIVEAVPAFVETLTHHLTGAGYRVAIARSGTEALEKARRLQPCVIFLNPALPTLSGWDVLTLLKSNAKTQHIPVVITATGLDAHQSPHHHVDGFLSLPVQAKDLQQTLQHLLLGGKPVIAKDTNSDPLTILHLYPDVELELRPDVLTRQINDLFQAQRYRILESHDLEQAELLARVWRPDVVLLSSPQHDPLSYLRQLSDLSFIASLPLVTLDQPTTQAANQVPGLLVFPCLALEPGPEPHPAAEISTLQQVIQIAAGYVWRPLVLAVDVATLAVRGDGESRYRETEGRGGLQEAEWLQALKQYLHTSGLRGCVGRAWPEVLQQVASGGADVLVLCWTADSLLPELEAQLMQLAAIADKMPIVVLDHRQREEQGEPELSPLPMLITQMARRILSAHVSMTELLQQLQAVLEAVD